MENKERSELILEIKRVMTSDGGSGYWGDLADFIIEDRRKRELVALGSIEIWEEINTTCELRAITLSRGQISIIRDAICTKFGVQLKRRDQETITHNDLRADEILSIFEDQADTFGYVKMKQLKTTDGKECICYKSHTSNPSQCGCYCHDGTKDDIQPKTAEVPSVEELSKVTVDLVEEHFPKNQCQERGKAIVLHATMLIAIHDLLTRK